MVNIVLFNPEIPHNTGAIARSCFVTGAKLHLIHPLGFHLDERSVARAGLDYWEQLDVSEYLNFDEFLDKNPGARLFLVETRAGTVYSDANFCPGDFLVFGSETKGLPDWLMDKYLGNIVNVPMKKVGRSLNLSVCVGVVLFEALRQNDFGGM